MGNTGRVVLGVIAGAVVWAVLWLGGTMAAQAALPDLLNPGQRLDHAGALTGYILYSVVLSVLAGAVAALVAKGGPAMRAVWILALLQLGLGVFFEVSAWDLVPAWYHVVFLALIVPATVYWGSTEGGVRGRGGTSGDRSSYGTWVRPARKPADRSET